MRKVSLRELLEAGVHFGHKTSKWHPAAEEYIFEERDNVHIIDLAKTKAQLEKAGEKVAEIVKGGGKVLFVGTKRQAGKVVKTVAEKAGIPYMSNRWIGGMITNWEEVKKNIDRMRQMEKEEKEGGWKKLPKHEQLEQSRELTKLRRVYAGVADLTDVPEAVYIIDVRFEKTVVREAQRAGIVSIGISDTNSDPRTVTIPIPANDDAVGSVEYITKFLADAYVKGRTDKKTT